MKTTLKAGQLLQLDTLLTQLKIGLLVYVCWALVFIPLLKLGPVVGRTPWLLSNKKVRANSTAQSKTVAEEITILRSNWPTHNYPY